MNRLRVVLDTNVYVSGIQFGGVPAEILAQAVEGAFVLCVSDAILEELVRTLRTKFDRSVAEIRQACHPIRDIATHVAPDRSLRIADDPDDNVILECAIAADADIIVSGDDHILRLGRSSQPQPIDRLRFLTPRQFLDILNP